MGDSQNSSLPSNQETEETKLLSNFARARLGLPPIEQNSEPPPRDWGKLDTSKYGVKMN